MDGDGPLSATSGEGSISMWEPPDVEYPWYGTFGAFILCAQNQADRIELERVTWRAAADAAPVELTPWLRSVNRQTEPTTPAYGVSGLPWEPGDMEPLPGSYTDEISGVEITQSCSDLKEGYDVETESQPEFTELMLVVKSAEEGAHIERTYVDYLANGKPHRLTIRWEMVTCGTVIESRHNGGVEDGDPQQDWCPPDRQEQAKEARRIEQDEGAPTS